MWNRFKRYTAVFIFLKSLSKTSLICIVSTMFQLQQNSVKNIGGNVLIKTLVKHRIVKKIASLRKMKNAQHYSSESVLQLLLTRFTCTFCLFWEFVWVTFCRTGNISVSCHSSIKSRVSIRVTRSDDIALFQLVVVYYSLGIKSKLWLDIRSLVLWITLFKLKLTIL